MKKDWSRSPTGLAIPHNRFAMEEEFSFRTRDRALKEAATKELDLVVIGGGITGAGIAWDAASRGIHTAAFERSDFAHATSSKTSKMIHGGLRYLRNFEFSLVRESLRERKFLLENAGELVSWLPLIIPLFSRWDELKFQTGLVLYDALANEPGRKHRRLNKEQVAATVPFLDTPELRGGLEYWDAVMDDSRLNLAVVASAAGHGALIANHTEVEDFVFADGRVSGVRVRDRINDETFTVRARQVVNATGPWGRKLDQRAGSSTPIRLRPNRGAHLIVSRRRLPTESGLAMPLPGGRLLFVIPWQGKSVLGTTESTFAGELDCIGAEGQEVDFLLELAARFFPSVRLSRPDILASFAGVRPLVDAGNRSLANISREAKIVISSAGLITVAGGKYTTFRRMAEEVVDRVVERSVEHLRQEGRGIEPCRTKMMTLDGVLPPSPDRIPTDEAIRRSIHREMAMTLDDLLVRRTKSVLLDEDQGLGSAERASRIMAEELGWTDAERHTQVSSFRNQVSECFKRGELL